MRTLKKVLALSLVFAMAFTMMAGAAFKDQDKIDSSLNDDISLLTALGVFKGDENGNFNPTDNVKRSEAAKMIYVLKNNGVDDGAVAFQGVSKYSDVPVGHWAEGYINYCTNLGYMGGWQENGVQKFDPNGNVTGVELMKMLLCMIGYKADVQGYTGAGWQTNVLVDAATSGLSVNFTPSVYGATPRQWTARLMVNALNAYWVSYSKGELTYADNTYAQQYMKLYSATGTLVATQTNAIDATATDTVKTDSKYSTITDVKYSNKSETTASVDFEYAVPNELLGQEVRVYFRGNSTTENVLGTSNKVYGVTATGNQKVINTTLDAVKFDDNYATNYKVTIEGLGTKAYTSNHASNIDWYVNYAKQTATSMDDQKASGVLGTNSTLPVKIIADKDGYVKSFMVTGVPTYGVVSKLDAENGVFEIKNASAGVINLQDLSTNNITFNKANKENFEKYLNVASDVKVGDVVQCMATVDGGLKWTVTKLENIGAASGYTVKDATDYATIKVNGTDYKLSARKMTGYDWTINGKAGTHTNFYTDGKYVVYSTGASSAATVDNLAYITNVLTTGDSWGNAVYKVKAILSDGTTGEYTVNAVYDELGVQVAKASNVAVSSSADPSLNGTTLNDGTRYDTDIKVKEAMEKLFKNDSSNKAALEQVFTYSLDDGKINLNIIKTANAQDGNNATYRKNAGVIAYTQKTGIATIGTVQYRTTDDTYFFVKDSTNNKYSVVKASELKADINTSVADKMFVAQTVNGFDTLLVGVLEIASVPTAKAQDYYFVTGNASYVGAVDGKHVVELPVNAAGTESKLTFKYDTEGSASNDMNAINGMKGKLIQVALKSDGSVDVNATGGYTKGMKVVPTSTLAAAPVVNTWNDGNLTAWDGTNAVIGDGTNSQIVKIASDVKVFNVNVEAGKKAALVEGDSVVLSDGANTSVVVYFNADKEVSVVFVEIDGADITGTDGIVA